MAGRDVEVREDRAEVLRALDELRELARGYSLADLRSGEWLPRFVSDVLSRHAREANIESFGRRYPGLAAHEVIDRLVTRARRRAALEGALTAGASTAAVAVIIGSGGAASLLSLPAGVLAFVTDMLYLTALQLHLGYDISVLCGHPVDLDDPAEVRDLLRVSLGAKPGDELVIDPYGIDVSDVARYVARGVSRMSRTALSVLGKRLLRQALVKLTVPAVSIPLSSGMNYLSAGRTAELAQQVYQDKARARKLAAHLAVSAAADPRLLLDSIRLVMNTDDRGRAEESWLYNDVTVCLARTDEGARAVAESVARPRATRRDVLSRLTWAPNEVREAVYEAVCVTATMDRDLGWRERRLLRQLARACSVPFDVKALRAQASRTR